MHVNRSSMIKPNSGVQNLFDASFGMVCTKRTEDVRKAGKARKTKEVNKKTTGKGKRVGKRAQTASYKKLKELGRVREIASYTTRHMQHMPQKGENWQFAIVKLVQLKHPHLSQMKRIGKNESEDEKVEEEEGGKTGEDEEEEEEEKDENGEDEEETK
ncbi:hypothetical protein Sjap_018140 [Stephania japonica]|uniref:Uncharacterized protein n=1 Tax=Stephania japonica TaxID=461633 RepID=A0AAP0NL87_9MAGN